MFLAFTCPIDSINTLQMARHKVQHMLFFLMTKRRFWFEIEKCRFKIGKNAAITLLNPLFFSKTFSDKFSKIMQRFKKGYFRKRILQDFKLNIVH
ncbi:MAG: hypothetical protein EBS95_09415 [Chitinophagia bacterium]|nr:hypothetical protein [Chitinophagia bacterium]